MFSTMRSCKMLFIIVWKVAKLLVISKNIIKSPKSLQLVQNVALHSFLGFI